jgi:hypothetical protein
VCRPSGREYNSHGPTGTRRGGVSAPTTPTKHVPPAPRQPRRRQRHPAHQASRAEVSGPHTLVWDRTPCTTGTSRRPCCRRIELGFSRGCHPTGGDRCPRPAVPAASAGGSCAAACLCASNALVASPCPHRRSVVLSFFESQHCAMPRNRPTLGMATPPNPPTRSNCPGVECPGRR